MTVQIIVGDCRERLAELADQGVHCCVTSPPYFGLRDYGVDGQMGLEATPEEYVAGMVTVFREVRRVLRDDGTLWLNMGDSYAGSGRGNGSEGSKQRTNAGSLVEPTNRGSTLAAGFHEAARQADAIGRAWVKPPKGLKQKDLIGVPWLLAFALRADGWYLRQDIIWSKPNPMPESIRDRCTKAHEYIFLLSKSERYYFDAAAIREDRVGDEDAAIFRGGSYVAGEPSPRVVVGNKRVRGVPPRHAQYGESSDQSGLDMVGRGMGRNKRSVWEVATSPFSEAHFATFPPALIEPCILAGCPVGGTVLDPFGGAGTTGLVADRLQRNAILIELNPEYAEMARRRIDGDRGGLLDAMEVAS